MNLPTPPGGLDAMTRGYFVNLIKALNIEFNNRYTRNTAQPSVLLASPNGSVYTVTVTDAGVLQTTLTYDAP